MDKFNCYIAGVFLDTTSAFIGWFMVIWHLTNKLFPAKCPWAGSRRGNICASVQHFWGQRVTMHCLPASTRDQTVTKGGMIMRSEGSNALLPASARDQTVTKGGTITMGLMFTSCARRVFQTVFFFSRRRKLYNKSLNDWSLGKQWILFPSNFEIKILGKQNSLFPSGPVMKCSMYRHALTVDKGVLWENALHKSLSYMVIQLVIYF